MFGKLPRSLAQDIAHSPRPHPSDRVTEMRQKRGLFGFQEVPSVAQHQV